VNDIEVKERYEVKILTCLEGVGDLKMSRASEGTGGEGYTESS
jgi:hypothetical protein